MTVTEKVAYLKGLMEGLSIDTEKPEGKILKAMADILDDLSVSVSDLEEDMDDIKEYVDELDDDLTEVEDIVYDDAEEDDDSDFEDEDDEDEGGDFVEVECPYCGETVYFDPEDVDPENIVCPSCNQGFSCICDECDGACEDCDACEDCEELKKLDEDDE